MPSTFPEVLLHSTDSRPNFCTSSADRWIRGKSSASYIRGGKNKLKQCRNLSFGSDISQPINQNTTGRRSENRIFGNTSGTPAYSVCGNRFPDQHDRPGHRPGHGYGENKFMVNKEGLSRELYRPRKTYDFVRQYNVGHALTSGTQQ